MFLRDRVADWLYQQWYKSSRPPYVLIFFSSLYEYAVEKVLSYRLRRLLKLPRPEGVLWSVTNVTVGGNAKTPMVLYLSGRAQSAGVRVAILTRGYGRKRQGQRHSLETARVRAEDSAERVGDEARMMAQATSVPVYCIDDPVHFLSEYGGCYDLWIADDLWSRIHYWAEAWWMRDVLGHGNGHFLPAGPLRCAPRWEHAPVMANVFCEGAACFYPKLRLIRKYQGEESYTPEAWPFPRVTVVTAIARPENVINLLRTYWGNRVEIDVLSFRDHAAWPETVTEHCECVVTTEKDAARLSYSAENIYVLCLEYEASPALEERVHEALSRVRRIRDRQVDL